MKLRSVTTSLIALSMVSTPGAAQSVPLDLSGLLDGPVRVTEADGVVSVDWPDETGRRWQAAFSLDPRGPLIRSIGPEGSAVLRDVRPFYQVETGTRRRGWNAFFDYPPSHPAGTRTSQGVLELRSAAVRTEGDRVVLTFDGLRMGLFDGAVAYTIYPGSRLIEQEAVMTTYQPNVAYYYDAGWEVGAAHDRTPGGNMATRVSYYDTAGRLTHATSTGFDPERVPVEVRHRTLALATGGGSLAVFPGPHEYFFPRDFTSNLGHVWHRSWRGRAAVGIRQIRDTNWQFYPWMNAPPGRAQRMSVFFLVSEAPEADVLSDVLAFTNGDRFRPLEGYKTLSAHWHLAYTVQALEHGFGWTPPWKPVLKEMGVDASIIMDFHGDGNPRDLTELRLEELDAYFDALRALSDPDFLVIPSEEANVHLGGHWALTFPKPVYWFMNRPEGGSFRMEHPEYGTVYSTADEAELLELVRREGGFMYQTHPRTKGSTGFPDRIRNTEHFRDAAYVGAGWKALPSDLSAPRLGDRSFDLLDDLSTWGYRKRIFGEVDVFQFDETHELYAHMNINYVRLDELPAFDDWGDALAPLVNGDFFTTTGEVLLPEVDLSASSGATLRARVAVDWTFPLAYAEVVWGDGDQVHRETIPLSDTRAFGSRSFEWSLEAPDWTWARVAVWDVAGNGAFVNPTWRE